MTRTIAIIAPMIDRHQVHADFILRLKANNRELTLAALHELASNGFNTGKVSRGFDYEQIIPSAGYYLEGLLRQQGYETVLTNQYDAESLKTMAEKDPFAILVSTTMIITTDSLLELLSSIRRTMPDTPLIAGGVLVWKHYFQYLDHLREPLQFPLLPELLFHPDNSGMDADILVVAPHGKASLIEILAKLDKGRNATIEEIPNLAFPRKSGFLFTKREEERVDYNEDFTRWDLVSEMPVKVPLRTSIGCPYRCSFCDFYRLYPKVFIRSTESLARELKLMKDRLGIIPGVIHVSDDNVFINKKRVHEVCTSIIESGMRFWSGFMRAGEYTQAEMDLIVRSGLMMGFIGVESGDPGQLERMNKRQDVEKVKRGIEQFDAHGINTMMTFVVGFPGETRQTLENTMNFMNSLKLDKLLASYRMFTLLVEPMSQLNNPQVREKWSITGSLGKWSHYTMNSDEVVRASFDLFKGVTSLPYHYGEESNFFNKAKFGNPVLNSLNQLRQQLTVKIIENAQWEQIEPILQGIAHQMNLPVNPVNPSFRNEIYVPIPTQTDQM
ncbi:MAG: radical SAM protein [Bacteroidota bacterium]